MRAIPSDRASAWQRPGRVVLALLGANVLAYVGELLLLRADVDVIGALSLTPAGVFEAGRLWQPLTYLWLHDPRQPTHLFLNLLWLFLFGGPLERFWGGARFLVGYLLFGLGGAAATLTVGLLSRVDVLEPILEAFWIRPHLGASGAVMGVVIGWGMVFSKQEMSFLFLGRMKARTFVAIVVAFELIVALSLSPVSSTSHFGGMATAFVLCGGWWRISRWRALFHRRSLAREKARIEAELRALGDDEGSSAGPKGKGPGDWN